MNNQELIASMRSQIEQIKRREVDAKIAISNKSTARDASPTQRIYEHTVNLADFAVGDVCLEVGAGTRLVCAIQGSAPGATFSVQFNGAPTNAKLTAFRPGSKYTLPFLSAVFRKETDCPNTGSVRFLVIVGLAEECDYEELFGTQSAVPSTLIGPSGATTQFPGEASAGLNMPVLNTDGISLIGISAVRAQISVTSLNGPALITGGQLRFWIFNIFNQAWGRLPTIEVLDTGLGTYQTVDFPVGVQQGRLYIECDGVTMDQAAPNAVVVVPEGT